MCGIASVRAAEVPQLLQQFNRSGSTKSANLYFEALREAGLLEEPVVMDSSAEPDSVRAAVWYWAAEYFYETQDFASAAQYGEQAIPLCRKYDDKVMHADCASLLGLVYVRLGDFSRAAMYAKECNKLDLLGGDPDNIASSYNTLAGIYMSMRQPDIAERYILQAMEYVHQAENPAREAVIYGMASEVYQHKNMPAKALEYATHAWELEVALGRTDKAAIRQTQRAAALTVLEQYSEAEACLKEAIPVLEKSGNYHSLAIAYNQTGDLYYVTGRNREGADYYYKALPIFVAQHDIYNEAHTRKGLRETLRGIDPEAALAHGDRFEHLRDSMYDHATNANLSQFAAEIENNILQELNRKQRLRSIIVIVLICVFFVLAACVSYVVHRRRHRRQVEHFNRLLREVEQYRTEERIKRSGEYASHSGSREEIDTALEDDDLFLARAVETISNILPEGDVTVDKVANAMHMSSSSLRRRILAITENSTKSFIQAVQLNKAKKLLSTASVPYDKAISDIAMLCGYKEASTFIRSFRQNTGMTPFQWRAQLRQQENQPPQEPEPQKNTVNPNINP